MLSVNNNRYGNSGSPISAKVNLFELSWSRTGVVYHYDVDITPNFQTKSGKPLELRAAKGSEIMSRLQTQIQPAHFPHHGAFDGKKNLYSFRKYHFDSNQYQVPLDAPRNSTSDNRRQKMVTVTITLVNSVNVNYLKKVIEPGKGQISDLSASGDYSIALNMLNLFVQAQPRRSHLHKGKSFYIDRNTSDRSDAQMSPLKLLDGLFQSVRPAMNRLVLNVDVTVGAVLPKSSLEDICMRSLKLKNLLDLHRLNSESEKFRKLRQFLKGVKITVDVGGNRRRERAIKDIIADVGNKTFTNKDGEEMTVSQHFDRAHGIKPKGPTLGVSVGNRELIPMTVCTVVNQVYKGRLQQNQVSSMLFFIPQNPRSRLQKIQTGWRELGHSTSEFLHGGGIQIADQPLRVNGRLLTPLSLIYGSRTANRRSDIVAPRDRGVWDVMNKTLQQPKRVDGMLVVNFAENRPSRVMSEFVNDLVKVMNERGMVVDRLAPIMTETGQNPDIGEQLYNLGSKYKPQLILAILPENALDLYNAIKRFGDVTQGVATQCVRWDERKIWGNYSARKVNQYQNNLTLKINGKLGGINHTPDSPVMKFLSSQAEGPFMIIGADVSHPGPGSKQPSIASVVASYDQQACRYVPIMHVQHSRLERIENISNMLTHLLSYFTGGPKFEKNQPPKRIIIFRDGVSEGEFETVREQELGAIKQTLQTMYTAIRRPMPKLTFIVVGKRHHYRFFPEQADADRTGNCQAGFVVDRDITHPVYQDFYLQSQAGLKGTSIPSHYTVLEDGNFGNDANQLQELAYALCHSYARSTRSVKIPAPVYYADLVCRRAKHHFDSKEVNYSDNMSVSSGGEDSEEQHLDHYRKHFRQAHPNILQGMYFL